MGGCGCEMNLGFGDTEWEPWWLRYLFTFLYLLYGLPGVSKRPVEVSRYRNMYLLGRG
jgi:hypothetical protein